LSERLCPVGIGVEAKRNQLDGTVVDGRIVFIQRAVTNRDGDWHATDSFYCSLSETGQGGLVLADSE